MYLLYPLNGSEYWTFEAKTKSRIVGAEIILMRNSLGYNWIDEKQTLEY